MVGRDPHVDHSSQNKELVMAGGTPHNVNTANFRRQHYFDVSKILF